MSAANYLNDINCGQGAEIAPIHIYSMDGAPFFMTPKELHLRSTLEQQTIEMSRYSAGYVAMRTGTTAIANLLKSRTLPPDTFDVTVLLDAVQARADFRATDAAEQVHHRIQTQHAKEHEANRKWYNEQQRVREQEAEYKNEMGAREPSVAECVQRCESDTAALRDLETDAGAPIAE